jgi:hypothetical protein
MVSKAFHVAAILACAAAAPNVNPPPAPLRSGKPSMEPPTDVWADALGPDKPDVSWPMDYLTALAKAEDICLPLKDALFHPIGQAEAPIGNFLFATIIPCRTVVQALWETHAALGATIGLVDEGASEVLSTHQLDVANHVLATNISCNNAVVQALPVDNADMLPFSHVLEAVHARFHRAFTQLAMPIFMGAKWLLDITSRHGKGSGTANGGRSCHFVDIPLLMSLLQPPPVALAVTHQSVAIINGASADAAGSTAPGHLPQHLTNVLDHPDLPVEDRLALLMEAINADPWVKHSIRKYNRDAEKEGEATVSAMEVREKLKAKVCKYWANKDRQRRQCSPTWGSLMGLGWTLGRLGSTLPHSASILSASSATSWTFQCAGSLSNVRPWPLTTGGSSSASPRGEGSAQG